ncbi:uncharacterized protein N7482_000401 [Penicillium canariense]|uniref:Thiaminase-2/PQQC domain-containing protein n=1 Tax=Penicillium canariense TaxID=189055 RepID=A0A9W9IE42_9EURO|nr:uncharacterized protein N7482_000401 [Penicillium canariense]KAJ5174524.1 hypothetical protein N7482_000401 [Penicillium canariense]
MTSQGPLTTWLLSATPQALKRATSHPFLASAGSGTLPKTTLSQWLSQDRLYAQSYIRFIGLLLTKIRIPPHNPNTETPRQPTLEQIAVDVLIDALVNIRTELRFFESTALEYGLDLTAISADEGGAGLAPSGSITTSIGISTTGSASCPGSTGASCLDTKGSCAGAEPGKIDEDPRPNEQLHKLCRAQGECQMQAGSEVCNPPSPERTANKANKPASPLEHEGPIFFAANRITRAYIDMFMSVGSAGVSVLEGLAVLWATEVCYLRAWRFAASHGKKREGEGEGRKDMDADGGALREKFIPNWSSVEFEGFVDRIGDVLDQMAEQTKGVEEAELLRSRCLEWWRQVVWLEERFWPALD